MSQNAILCYGDEVAVLPVRRDADAPFAAGRAIDASVTGSRNASGAEQWGRYILHVTKNSRPAAVAVKTVRQDGLIAKTFRKARRSPASNERSGRRIDPAP